MKSTLKPLMGIAALTLTLVFSGCKKDEETDNVSIVRNYPIITLNGDPVTSINRNEPFADPGATTRLGGAVITTQVRGTVDNTQLGFYNIYYIGRNPEGDSISTARLVAVVDPAVNNLDLTGTYVRAATGGVAHVTKIGKGLYINDNLGAVPSSNPGAIYPCYFAQLTPTTIEAPGQVVPGAGFTDFSNEALVLNGNGDVTAFKWTVLNPGFGTAVRTFEKQ